MVTFSQYIRRTRRTKKFKSSTPHFNGSPLNMVLVFAWVLLSQEA